MVIRRYNRTSTFLHLKKLVLWDLWDSSAIPVLSHTAQRARPAWLFDLLPGPVSPLESAESQDSVGGVNCNVRCLKKSYEAIKGKG